MSLVLRPWTVKSAVPFVANVHRRLPEVQGGLWAVRVLRDTETVGCAIVGHPARVWMDDGILAVLRVAVVEGTHNGCSMLYGACSRAARGMGATGLVTYTHADEHGVSLRAAGWVHGGMTTGGEHDRKGRQRRPAIDPLPKNRWWTPWSQAVQAGARSVAGETRPARVMGVSPQGLAHRGSHLVPCTVLDPFGGSGTTAGVAIAHGRAAILVEPSAEYRALIPDRIRDVVARETAVPRARRARVRDAETVPALEFQALPGAGDVEL